MDEEKQKYNSSKSLEPGQGMTTIHPTGRRQSPTRSEPEMSEEGGWRQTQTLHRTWKGKEGTGPHQKRKQQKGQPEAHQLDEQWQGRQGKAPCRKDAKGSRRREAQTEDPEGKQEPSINPTEEPERKEGDTQCERNITGHGAQGEKK